MDMADENISQELRLKNIDETKNILLKKLRKMNWWVRSTKRFVRILTVLNTNLFYLLWLIKKNKGKNKCEK